MTDLQKRDKLLLQLFDSDPLTVSCAYRQLLEFDKTEYMKKIEEENKILKSKILLLEEELNDIKKTCKNNCLEEKTWCVYKHVNKLNGKVYIGITSEQILNNRWDNGNGYKRNKLFYEDINKYGWIDGFYHVVLKENLSKSEAEEMEANLIKKYNANDKNFGYNIASGGATHSVNSIPVCKYDLNDNFIEEYCSISEAARNNNIGEWMIRKCLRNLIDNIGGYKWKYKDVNIKCSSEEQKEIGRRNSTVYQYSLDGNYMQSYKNSTEASLCTGINSSYITRSCRKENSRAGDFQWFYEYKGDNIEKYVSCDADKRKKTPVCVYDKDMNFIERYDTIPQAIKVLEQKLNKSISRNAIYECLKGRLKTAYGFVFKYAEKTN